MANKVVEVYMKIPIYRDVTSNDVYIYKRKHGEGRINFPSIEECKEYIDDNLDDIKCAKNVVVGGYRGNRGSNRRSHYRVDPNEVKSAIQKYCIDTMNDILEEKGYGPVKLLRNSVRFNPEMRDDSDDMIYYLYDFKDKDGVVTTGYYSFIKDRFGDWVPISETGEDENGIWPDLEDYAENAEIDLYN